MLLRTYVGGMRLEMKITEHFTLAELTKTQVRGADNTPPDNLLPRLVALAENILEPVRHEFGPVTINSAFRSLVVNQAVGGSRGSQHMLCEAADFEVRGVDNFTVAEWVRSNLDFDQLIIECYISGQPNSGWVHCSFVSPEANRGEVKTFDGHNYAAGLVQ